MSITLAITGRPSIVVDEQEISLGSASHCTIPFYDQAGVEPKHAVIRMVAGRWLIETRDGSAVYLADGAPKRLQWLKPGDVIRLIPDGPSVTFQPDALPVTLEAASTTSNAATIASPLHSEEYEVPILAEEYGLPVQKPSTNGPEPKDVSAANVFQQAIASYDDLPKTFAEESQQFELPKPAMLQRMSFEFQAPSPEFNEFDTPEPRETDPDVEWIIKIVIRTGAIGIVFLLIWLAFRDASL